MRPIPARTSSARRASCSPTVPARYGIRQNAVIRPDSGIEHGPADVFAVRTVAEICRMDLERVGGIVNERAFARVTPDRADFQVAEVGTQRLDFEASEVGCHEVPQSIDLGGG